MLNDWKPDLKSQARITELESAVRQAVMELREASNILAGKDLPSTAKVFSRAADAKAKLLEASHV